MIWEITTPVPDEKKGAVIAGSLPNDCKLKKDLKDKFFENVDVNKLVSKEGLGLVKTFLEEQLGEDELEKQIRTWIEFEDCERGNKDIEGFVSDLCSELKIVLGSGPGSISDRKSSEAFKVEPADIPSEDVLLSHGYVRKGGVDGYRGGYRGARGGGRGRGRGSHSGLGIWWWQGRKAERP